MARTSLGGRYSWQGSTPSTRGSFSSAEDLGYLSIALYSVFTGTLIRLASCDNVRSPLLAASAMMVL